jgi:hypothetical protein
VSGLVLSFSRSSVIRELGFVYVMNFVHHVVLKHNKQSLKHYILRDGIGLVMENFREYSLAKILTRIFPRIFSEPRIFFLEFSVSLSENT